MKPGEALKKTRAPDERPEPAATVALRVRCVFCHDGLEVGEAVHCAACLAQYHEECFHGHGRCAILGCAGAGVVRPARPGTRSRRAPFALALAGIVASALMATVLAVRYAPPPEAAVVATRVRAPREGILLDASELAIPIALAEGDELVAAFEPVGQAAPAEPLVEVRVTASGSGRSTLRLLAPPPVWLELEGGRYLVSPSRPAERVVLRIGPPGVPLER